MKPEERYRRVEEINLTELNSRVYKIIGKFLRDYSPHSHDNPHVIALQNGTPNIAISVILPKRLIHSKSKQYDLDALVLANALNFNAPAEEYFSVRSYQQ